MPAGANAKREREYEEPKHKFKEGRYSGREEEVAARIVNKQCAQYGESKEEKRKDRGPPLVEGTSIRPLVNGRGPSSSGGGPQAS